VVKTPHSDQSEGMFFVFSVVVKDSSKDLFQSKREKYTVINGGSNAWTHCKMQRGKEMIRFRVHGSSAEKEKRTYP
jgi:hypothetical protein